jgi:hypothetical protein
VSRRLVSEGSRRPVLGALSQENGRESVMDHLHVALFEFEWMS